MNSLFLWVRKPLIALSLAACCQAAWAGPEEDYTAGYDLYYKQGDMVAAMPLLHKAADAGYAPAQATLAFILDYSEFNDDAAVYYRKAAEQGNANGQFGLATMLVSGEGTKQDLPEARRLFTLAAEQGHEQSINVLAQAYISGQLGITEDQRQGSEALRWVKLSAGSNYLPAMKVLIDAYRAGGFGMPADVATADALQAKYFELQGLDKKGKPKKTPKQSP